MKSPLLLFILSLPFLSFSQITFEEVKSPDDFNIEIIHKSPTGEYFTQAVNESNGIYSSTNGVDWIRYSLPGKYDIEEIQFYSDGTPIISSSLEDPYIRKNGSWQPIKVPTYYPEIKATYIKGDSLFVYAPHYLAYSTDKGQTFTIAFELNQTFSAHTAKLWKFTNHYIIYYTTGASKYLTAYTETGVKLFTQSMGISTVDAAYNSCGELLLVQSGNYYRINDKTMVLETGVTKNIIPGFNSKSDLCSMDGNYYYRKDNEIYRSTSCDLNWELIATNDWVESKSKYWIGFDEEIMLYDLKNNYIIKQKNGTNLWEKQIINITYAYVNTVNENITNHQQTITSNAIFFKNLQDENWIKSDSTVTINDEIFNAPNGDLYIKKNQHILYSTNNGQDFSIITHPDPDFGTSDYSMRILDNSIIFTYSSYNPLCFYSLNNGKDWSEVLLSFSIYNPQVKFVNNTIIIAELSYSAKLHTINVSTNEVISHPLGQFTNLYDSPFTLSDDGTLYFRIVEDIFNNFATLYRFKEDEGLQNLGDFVELMSMNFFCTSGKSLFLFNGTEYHIFDGEHFVPDNYINLPDADKYKFILADNEVLYVILNDNRIFRSTSPLSFPHYISGSIFTSPNLDCVLDTTAVKLSNWQVKVESNDFKRIKNTSANGGFSFSVPPGDYTLSSQPISSNWALCTSEFDIDVNENTEETSQDFIAKALTDCAELEIDFSTPFLRRCFDNYYSIKIRNTGPASSEHTTLTLLLDPFYDVLSASLPYTQLNDSTLVFDLGTLALNEVVTIQLYFNLSCEAEFGAVHCLTGILQADNLCDVSRSQYTECQESIGSYDPNDKRVFDSGGRETTTIDKNEYIYYHIRFQNTGTDTAFNIVVEDPLSAKLDLSTLEMLSSSHPYDFYITERPTLVVNFDNVLLVDSTTNEPASHGYFKFRIKPLPGFDYGTSITNTAGIYFDFNDPIYTNEALLTIQSPLFTKEFGPLLVFDVYPNPATDNLTIVIADSERQHIDNYAIVNDLGQQVFHSSALINGQIPVHGLTAGKYKLVLKSKDTLIGIKEFVKF